MRSNRTQDRYIRCIGGTFYPLPLHTARGAFVVSAASSGKKNHPDDAQAAGNKKKKREMNSSRENEKKETRRDLRTFTTDQRFSTVTRTIKLPQKHIAIDQSVLPGGKKHQRGEEGRNLCTITTGKIIRALSLFCFPVQKIRKSRLLCGKEGGKCIKQTPLCGLERYDPRPRPQMLTCSLAVFEPALADLLDLYHATQNSSTAQGANFALKGFVMVTAHHTSGHYNRRNKLINKAATAVRAGLHLGTNTGGIA